MKIVKIICIAVLFVAIGCQIDDGEFGDVSAPTGLELNITIAQDQSGNVTVTPSSQGAINYHVFFVEDSEPVVINDGQTASFRYTQSGQYSQLINVIAYGRGGASSSSATTIELDVRLVIDASILSMIAGDANAPKRWIWDSENAGHFGVGAPSETFPNFFSAAPNSLDPCLYDDVLVFDHDGNDTYSFHLENNEDTFINWAEVKRFFPDATPGQFVDECRNINDQIQTDSDFVIIQETDGTLRLNVNGSTMSYWSGAMEYVITELTEAKMVVRGIQEPFDPTGDALAWYHTFVPESGPPPPPSCPSGSTGATGSGNNDVLVWADEFDVEGAPCDGNWEYDLGTGDGGWGNGESQFYTDRSENIIVEDGVLKIIAKADSFSGSNYTSARIKSKDKFEFKYGRVEVRAKLPTGGGTWPAIWTLGADIDQNPWPAAGEMDIMEHVGNNQDRVFSTVHFPGNSGGNAVGQDILVAGASDEFHIYELDWTAERLQFTVDGMVHFTFTNSQNVPFNKDFFLLLNVAMGGNFGGAIDPSFNQSTLEVDYVRVYQ